jgi:serine/threonine protein kinase
MSPELLQFSQYNSKNDIWSIGVCVYEMSTGQPCISRLNKNGRSELV